jgi:hypothetical protein
MVTVHHFRVWSITHGEYVVPAMKAPAEFIRMARGEIIDGTAEDVHPSALDSQGRYDPERAER